MSETFADRIQKAKDAREAGARMRTCELEPDCMKLLDRLTKAEQQRDAAIFSDDLHKRMLDGAIKRADNAERDHEKTRTERRALAERVQTERLNYGALSAQYAGLREDNQALVERVRVLTSVLEEAEPYADHTPECSNTPGPCSCDLAGWLGRYAAALESLTPEGSDDS